MESKEEYFARRNKKIYELRQGNPEIWSLRKLGRKFNLTQAGVAWVLKHYKFQKENSHESAVASSE